MKLAIDLYFFVSLNIVFDTEELGIESRIYI